MKVIIAIDSFKGCLTSLEAGQAVAEAFGNAGAETVVLNASDGGEGMLGAFLAAVDGERVAVRAHDAMMRPVESAYGRSGDLAIVEVAQACGLTLIEEDVRNAVAATSYGVGEIVADCLSHGCRRFIVGLGGSATTDAGMGMLRAMIDRLAPAGGHFGDLRQLLDGCEFTLASDVRNPLYGPDGAAHVFAPQKGATPSSIPFLDNRLRRFAAISARHFGYDCSSVPGAGAAGGLGYAFMQYMKAECRSGAELLLDLLRFDSLLEGADMVVTGEGSADRQTLMGKLPSVVMRRSAVKAVPVVLLCGRLSDASQLRESGFSAVAAVSPSSMPLTEAMRPDVARRNIVRCIEKNIGEWTSGLL